MSLLSSASDVGDYLRGRGIVADGEATDIQELRGGVSAVTYRVVNDRLRLVVKQPLPELDVSDSWPASVGRAGVEARAMAYLHRITPEAVPELISYDADEHVIVAACAPTGWVEWRRALLAGQVDAHVAAALGRVLARWHSASVTDEEARHDFADLTGFLELRGRPYFETTARRCPDLSGEMLACLEELLADRRCLVHGDFAPKNVLVGGTMVWVVDFEVAHIGSPIFDVAFMLHHLLMKSIHLPESSGVLRSAAQQFLSGYCAASGVTCPEGNVVRQTGALLLARVFGKSPTAYLTPNDAESVVRVGTAAVRREFESLDDLIRV